MGLQAVFSRAVHHLGRLDEVPGLLFRPEVLITAALPSIAYVIAVILIAGRKRAQRRPSEEAALEATGWTLFSQFVTNVLVSLVLEPSAPSVVQVLQGMFLLDTVEYFCHRAMHMNRRLYGLAHATHHSVPMSAELALYNAAAEAGCTGFLIFLTFAMTDVGYSSFIIVTTLGDIKTVWDHSRYSTHHLQHHVQPDCNYEQPFFDVWDQVLGTKAEDDDRKKRK